MSPLTASERLKWATVSTVGPANLAGGLFSSAWGTLVNKPKEYGPHWEGFGKRNGLRLTVGVTGNFMEAGMGALWGEDPRYYRASGSFKHRVGHVLKSAFLAHDRNGHFMPAYARYMAIPGSNFLSNTWRPDSQATVPNAILRTGYGFGSRLIGTAFAEFFPDITKKLFKRK